MHYRRLRGSCMLVHRLCGGTLRRSGTGAPAAKQSEFHLRGSRHAVAHDLRQLDQRYASDQYCSCLFV